jgi:rare lipoprotein A
VTVRINDRGPFAKGRILDLSRAAAEALAMTGNGTDQIEMQVVGFTGRPGGIGVLRIQIGSFAELQNAQMLFQKVDGTGSRSASSLRKQTLSQGRPAWNASTTSSLLSCGMTAE